MEMSTSTFTTQSSSTPLNFFNHGLNLKQLNPSIPATISRTNTFNSLNQTRKRSIQVKAFNGSFEHQTLSSNWEISGTTAPYLPRFEELDTTNMLLRQRIIFLGSQIDDTTADFIISQLLLLDAEDSKKDIKLFINSPGGSVTAGMGIYDAMKQCKADVSTICMGLAASMGAFLLASGSKGKRYCMPNSRVMIHQPLGTAGGKGSLFVGCWTGIPFEVKWPLPQQPGPLDFTYLISNGLDSINQPSRFFGLTSLQDLHRPNADATEMSIRIREMNYHKLKLNKILSRITGKPEEQIEIDTDRDNFMNPWEAKAYGLIDAVIDDGKPGLIAPIGETTAPPKTKVWDLWKIEGSRKAKKNLPSENKILRNGYAGSQDNQDNESSNPL